MASVDRSDPDALKGTTLKVYRYLFKLGKPAGIRDIQRALGLSSSSVAEYHLKKLLQSGLIREDGEGYVVDEGKVIGTVLNSSVVTQYTKTSFSYNWWYESRESCTSELPPILKVNVTGSQNVNGNWTSQYLVTYSNNTLITAEVSFSYQITSMNVTKLPDLVQGPISYTAQQQQVIEVALSNSTVRQITSGITYYVPYFYHFGSSGNQTYANDYYVVLNQVNGPLSIGIYLNSNAKQVIGVYQYHDCRYNSWSGTSCTP